MRFIYFFRDLFVPTKHNAYQPYLLRRDSLAAFLLIVLVSEGLIIGGALIQPDANAGAVVASDVISLTNDERSLNNVNKLAENELLDRAAQAKADDMAAKSYFSHVGPDGKEPWAWIKESGYDYRYAGENLAVHFVDSQDVVTAWMNSPSHRANIVKPVYEEIGIGIAEGVYQGTPAVFVVQYFGALRDVVAAVPEAPAPTPMPTEPISGTVAAAETIQPSLTQTTVNQITKAVSNPNSTSNWLLGGTAALVAIALFFTFFMHIQVQPKQLLINGSLVVFLAVSLLAANKQFNLSAGPAAAALSQTAIDVGLATNEYEL